MRNKAKLEGELWDERLSSSSGQNSHLVSKATRLWESILARKGTHTEVSLWTCAAERCSLTNHMLR
jgi:hypothetical protein